MKIGVDIDNTVVDTGGLWLMYLKARYPEIPVETPFTLYPYDLTKAFVVPEGVDGYAFWKDPNLYEGLEPWEDAVTYLSKLKEEGHEIIFISQAKGWHHKSKYYFIDKWFPFKDGVILTKEKHYIDVDVMIDDTYHVLDKMPEDVMTIKFREDYDVGESSRQHVVAGNWAQVYQLIHCGRTNEQVYERN